MYLYPYAASLSDLSPFKRPLLLQRLSELSGRIQRLDISLNILEAKVIYLCSRSAVVVSY